MSGTQDHVLLGESARKLMISKYQIKPMPRNNLNTDKKILQTQQHGWGSTFFLADPNPAIFLYADPDPDKAAF